MYRILESQCCDVYFYSHYIEGRYKTLRHAKSKYFQFHVPGGRHYENTSMQQRQNN